MNKSSAIALGLVATLLYGGAAVAQTASTSNPTDADRIERHCTTGTIGSGTAAQCSDDAVNDGGVVRSTVGIGSINPAVPSNPASTPSTVPPSVPTAVGSVGDTISASPGNPATMGNPGSLSNTPPSLSNNPPSPSPPGNTTGNSSTGGGTTVVVPAGRR